MSRKIVGTQLFAGILAKLLQITAPLLQKIEIFLCQGIISIRLAARGHHQQHIGAFFHGHLAMEQVGIRRGGIKVIWRMRDPHGLMLGTLACAINLAGQYGISAHIVGRKIIDPNGHSRKPEDRPQHSAHQFGAIH